MFMALMLLFGGIFIGLCLRYGGGKNHIATSKISQTGVPIFRLSPNTQDKIVHGLLMQLGWCGSLTDSCGSRKESEQKLQEILSGPFRIEITPIVLPSHGNATPEDESPEGYYCEGCPP